MRKEAWEKEKRSVTRVEQKVWLKEAKQLPKDLSVRIHWCPSCGLVLDRDVNASRNILARALASEVA